MRSLVLGLMGLLLVASASAQEEDEALLRIAKKVTQKWLEADIRAFIQANSR